MTKRVEDLVLAVCGPGDLPLAPVLRGWCETSRPFLAFAEAHAPKIRKKVRLAVSAEEQADLLAELGVAALLLRDARFTVVYEPPRAPGERGPDFGVTWRTHLPLSVEVTRLRPAEPAEEPRKLARVLCDKIGQFPAGSAGLLAVALPPGVADEGLVPAALRLLGGAPVPELRPEAVREFQRARGRLSAVALCSFSTAGQPLGLALWLHPGAKHPLPPDLTRALIRAGNGEATSA